TTSMPAKSTVLGMPAAPSAPHSSSFSGPQFGQSASSSKNGAGAAAPAATAASSAAPAANSDPFASLVESKSGGTNTNTNTKTNTTTDPIDMMETVDMLRPSAPIPSTPAVPQLHSHSLTDADALVPATNRSRRKIVIGACAAAGAAAMLFVLFGRGGKADATK